MIKEHKLYTKSDRTSCHRWEANQFRLFLHSGAYWLLHQLRQAAPRRSLWRKATFETIRRAFLKIAVRIEELKASVRSPCRQPIHIRKPSSRWQAASPPRSLILAACAAARDPNINLQPRSENPSRNTRQPGQPRSPRSNRRRHE